MFINVKNKIKVKFFLENVWSYGIICVTLHPET